MSLCVEIEKRLGDFSLHTAFTAGVERLALLGASGCGKSVTLRCIAGILTPDAGHIALDGQVLYDSAAHINLPPQQRNVGYLFQQYALFPHMTVRQNIAVAVHDRQRREAIVEEKLRQFRLTDVAALRPQQLSGGQQQRVALARILAANPRVILLDEPFSALDSYLKYQLELELSDTLETFPGPVVWVSHDRGEVWRNCTQVCVMERGHSEPVVSMEQLFHHPCTESAARLSGCKNYVAAIPRGDFVEVPPWGITLQCGRGAVPPATCTVGIRSHHVHLATGDEVNQISCRVERVIDDVFGTIVLLHPINSAPDAPLLRMELSKADWASRQERRQVVVSVAPENLLLLHPSSY